MPPAVLGCASLLNPTDGGVPVVWYGLPGGTSLLVLLQPAGKSDRIASESDRLRTAVVCLRRSIGLTSWPGSPHLAAPGSDGQAARIPPCPGLICGPDRRGELK